MDFFSLFPFGSSRSPRAKKKRKNAPVNDHPCRRPQIEPLEDRLLLSSSAISGHVFRDANNNGRFDQGEMAIANSELELQNSSGQVIGTTTTDANGFYKFDYDGTVDATPTTLEQTFTTPPTLAGFSMAKAVQQFNPSLGQLVEVEIISDGSLTSEIKAENNSTNVGATIKGKVAGTLTLTGPGFSLVSSQQENAGSFVATPFDGDVDFGGSSGKTLDPATATFQSKSIKLTGADVQPFVGTSSVNFQEQIEVDSTASGGGNLLMSISSLASTNFLVRYKYVPSNSLKPGDYTIIQKTQPDGYLDGKDSSAGVLQPNSIGTDRIHVTMAESNLVNNDFGEVQAGSLSGMVYNDANNNGVKDSGEAAIGGVTIKLTGSNDLGPVNLTTTTAEDGTYQFGTLRPGTYSLQETQPQGYLDGKDTAGDAGGTAANDKFDGVIIGSGQQGKGYNFGEIKPASISGFVYHDANNNGVKDAGEQGIAGAKVQLTTSTTAGPIGLDATTDASGFYKFDNLLPATYTLTETQPDGFLDGKDFLGSGPGTAGNDSFENITLTNGTQAENYNFGEILKSSLSGFVYRDANDNGTMEGGEQGIAGVKVQLTGTTTDGNSVTKEATTGSDGGYLFKDLVTGTYSLQQTQPSGFLDGKDSLGSASGTPTNDAFTGIALNDGVNGTNYNFGELQGSKLSGKVFEDTNNNGSQDAGENGIAGVKITLTGQNGGGGVNQETTTAADGTYQFGNLTPGSYTLQETQPAGYVDGQNSPGSVGGSITGDAINSIPLGDGQDGQNYNFAERLGADLGVVKTTPISSVLAGETVDYTITVTNSGPSLASQVRVDDVLPQGMTFLSATAPGWSMETNGNNLTFLRDNLAVGASSTITVTALAALDPGTYNNTVAISSSTFDVNQTNNSSSAAITIQPTIISADPPPILPPDVPATPAPDVLTKSLILSSNDFWLRMLKARM